MTQTTLPDSCRKLMDMVKTPHIQKDLTYEELESAQLQAAQDRFEECREQIQVLRQRSEDEGISRIRSKQDIVPLLFSHMTYKSYPESVVLNARWNILTKWYASLCAVPVEVDLSGVETVDEWVDRMWSAGHYVYATSGTTGKCSFLNHTQGDRAFAESFWANWTGWPNCLTPGEDPRRYYAGFPEHGPQAPLHWFSHIGKLFGKEGARFFVGKEPVRVSHLNRVGAMRKAMADGTASAEDVAAFQREMAEREKSMLADIHEIAEDMVTHRHEPIFMSCWQIIEDILNVGRDMGIPDGDFSDVFILGSGRKKYRGKMTAFEQDDAAMKFFGAANVKPRNMFYGMTELGVVNPMCEQGVYHVAPWVMLLLLDRNGNSLVEQPGQIVEGRAGFFDFSREGRWGGVISGDRLQVDFSPTCACGRTGPTIRDSVTRYSDTGDDKLDCAGTFDAYVKGALGDAA